MNTALRRLSISMFVMSLAIPVYAQTAGEPHLAVGGGAGIATPFHGDFDFTPLAWSVSVRGHAERHLIIEGFMWGWRHTSSQTFDAGRIEQQTTRTVRVVGVNILGRSTGRLSFYGGGGPGYWLHARRFTQTPGSGNTFNSSTFTVQGVGGFDAAITSRLIAFGEYQVVVPIEDPGIGHGAVTAGVRLALR
jgi:hypothetical protein